ncbi:MAG: 8-oxo-dGTP diphosphatase [Pseudomonadota bacterium]|jgi:8-oxo-dGTP diphosphatase
MQIDWNLWTPKDIAVLCFIFRDEEVLLIEKLRGLGAGKVNAPGGRLEQGETPLQAAIREVQEEISVTPHTLSQVGNLRFAFVDGYNLECWVFRAEDHSGTPTQSPEAIPFWSRIDALPYDRMWADDKHWLPYLLKGQKFFGEFVFDGELMLGGGVRPVES